MKKLKKDDNIVIAKVMKDMWKEKNLQGGQKIWQ